MNCQQQPVSGTSPPRCGHDCLSTSLLSLLLTLPSPEPGILGGLVLHFHPPSIFSLFHPFLSPAMDPPAAAPAAAPAATPAATTKTKKLPVWLDKPARRQISQSQIPKAINPANFLESYNIWYNKASNFDQSIPYERFLLPCPLSILLVPKGIVLPFFPRPFSPRTESRGRPDVMLRRTQGRRRQMRWG